MQWRRMAIAQPMPPPQSAVKTAIVGAARSDDSHRIVQPQRRAGFAGGEGVEGQAGAMVICSRAWK